MTDASSSAALFFRRFDEQRESDGGRLCWSLTPACCAKRSEIIL
jgi:hypothetical protein